MTTLRRLAYGALAFAFLHIVFGAVVRITGSGLGCGNNWPLCHGYLFPPLSRVDLIIEVTHRYLAAGLGATVLGLAVASMVLRARAGVGGRGGVLRPAALAALLYVSAALFGALTVKLELNNPYVIVVHLAIAVALLATLAVAVLRAGGLGADDAIAGGGSARTYRAAAAAAGLAFVAVVFGGLTAHVVGANGACQGFPTCTRGVLTHGAPLHVQLTHRAIAFLLLFHSIGLAIGVARRRESPLLVSASRIALGTIVLQIVVAAALVELHLLPVLRSLHQAVGTLVWLTLFVFAVLARRSMPARGALARASGDAPRPDDSSLALEPASVTAARARIAARLGGSTAAERQSTSGVGGSEAEATLPDESTLPAEHALPDEPAPVEHHAEPESSSAALPDESAAALPDETSDALDGAAEAELATCAGTSTDDETTSVDAPAGVIAVAYADVAARAVPDDGEPPVERSLADPLDARAPVAEGPSPVTASAEWPAERGDASDDLLPVGGALAEPAVSEADWVSLDIVDDDERLDEPFGAAIERQVLVTPAVATDLMANIPRDIAASDALLVVTLAPDDALPDESTTIHAMPDDAPMASVAAVRSRRRPATLAVLIARGADF